MIRKNRQYFMRFIRHKKLLKTCLIIAVLALSMRSTVHMEVKRKCSPAIAEAISLQSSYVVPASYAPGAVEPIVTANDDAAAIARLAEKITDDESESGNYVY